MKDSAIIAQVLDNLNRPAPSKPFSDSDMALLQSIVAHPWEAPEAPRRTAVPRGPMRIGILLALLAITVAAVNLGPDGLGASPAAAEILNKAATQSLSEADPLSQSGDYLQVTQTMNGWSSDLEADPEGTRPETATPIREVVRTWIPRTTSGSRIIIREVKSDLPRLSHPPQQLVEAPDLEYLDPSFYEKLPTDAEALMNYLHANQAGQPAGDALYAVEPILESGLASAKLRATIFKMLADMPGIETVTDRSPLGGSSDIAIRAWNFYLVFDRETGAYVGSLKPDGAATDPPRFTSTTVRTQVVQDPPTIRAHE